MSVCKLAILCLIHLTIFCNSVYAYATRPTLISEKIKTDKSLCIFPSKDLYSLDILTVCDHPVPTSTNITEYLKYDLSLLLCMSLYDVSIMLCELSQQDPTLKDQIPVVEIEFNTLIEKLENVKGYSPLDNFCSAAVHNTTLRDRTNSSYDTFAWINYFNRKLRDEKQCHQLCHFGLDNPNKVNPICLFIMWSNVLYSQSLESGLNQKNHDVNKADEENGENLEASKPEEEKSPIPIANNVGVQENVNKVENLSKVENVPKVDNELNKLPLSANSPVEENDNVNKQPQLESGSKIKIKLEEIKIEMEDQNSQKDSTVASNNKLLPDSQDNQSLDGESHVKEESKNIKTPGIDGETPNSTTDQKSSVGSDPMTSVTSAIGTKETVAQVPQTKDPEPKDDEIPPVKPAENVINIPIDGQEYLGNDENPGKTNDEDSQAQESPAYQEDDDDMPAKENEPPKLEVEEPAKEKSNFIVQDDHFIEAEDSHFFTNFVSLAGLCIIAYLVFHNKKKLLALAVEGKRRGPNRRRPNTASYSKLDCNLEEAMVSNTTASVTHVLY